jgi:hypothetical protein
VKVKLKIEGYGGVDRLRTEEYVWNRRDSVVVKSPPVLFKEGDRNRHGQKAVLDRPLHLNVPRNIA